MNELIKITKDESGKQVVSARELHSFFNIETPFSIWIKRMLDYGFEEGLDFVTFLLESTGGRPSEEYAISLDMAKEISMLQRTAKGKVARMYFIDCEKKLSQIVPRTHLEVLKSEMALLIESEQIKNELIIANSKIEQDKPKVVFADSVIGSSNSILVRQFAKDLCDSGFEIGQNRVFEWFRDNKYLNPQNEPYQNIIAMGLFEVIVRTIGSGEQTFTTRTTKITGKGAVYFAEKIKKQQQSA